MRKKKEDQFEKLPRIIKEEGEDIRKEIGESERRLEQRLERRMDEGFSDIKRRLDTSVQPQLDEHARRIKDLEVKTERLSHSRSR